MKLSEIIKNRSSFANDGSDVRTERQSGDITIALAGNPNVGKSTVFNALTGLKRHTGNWSGKTVSSAEGLCIHGGRRIILADLPGTYSLTSGSAEEETARDYLLYGSPDAVIVVCDASCIERNLILALQIMEITPHVMICVNLTDEAEKKNINTDTAKLEELLGVPVCPTSARSGKGLEEMLSRLDEALNKNTVPCPVKYPGNIEKCAAEITEELNIPRFAALRIIAGDRSFISLYEKHIGSGPIGCGYCRDCRNFNSNADIITAAAVHRCSEITSVCVDDRSGGFGLDSRIDRILTHRIWSIPIMLAALILLFYLTAEGLNYPSALLMKILSAPEEPLKEFLLGVGCPEKITLLLCEGVWRVAAWVVSVMLPPMAVFFPIFTLLEDSGYLPRAAFNLDRLFRASGGCGKQALTMAMGLGCTSAGVTGCRIIDSPREKLIAVITNSFTPCNGKLPAITAMISIFIMGGESDVYSALAMTAVLIFSFLLTLAVSKLLSVTILKGESSSFVLELPSYRKPQLGTVLIRSLTDRTAAVLVRAIISAIPAGAVIWLCANVNIGDGSLLSICSAALDPFGKFLGLDGKILMAFILGFPANETVLPILLMAYTASSGMTEYADTAALGEILRANGWTVLTAVCMIIMMICHIPCAASCLTIKHETGSLKQTVISMFVPLAAGIILCSITAAVFRIFT